MQGNICMQCSQRPYVHAAVNAPRQDEDSIHWQRSIGWFATGAFTGTIALAQQLETGHPTVLMPLCPGTVCNINSRDCVCRCLQ